MVVSSTDLARQRNLPVICWSLCFWACVMGFVLSIVAICILEPQFGGVNGESLVVRRGDGRKVRRMELGTIEKDNDILKMSNVGSWLDVDCSIFVFNDLFPN